MQIHTLAVAALMPLSRLSLRAANDRCTFGWRAALPVCLLL